MKGYVAKKGNRYYAVVYEGLDPITGKEVRKWHPAGTCRGDAETLASRLAAEVDDATDSTRSLTFGAYLTTQWLPGKANTLAESTWHSYRRKIERHILPTLGAVPIRRLKVTHLVSCHVNSLMNSARDWRPSQGGGVVPWDRSLVCERGDEDAARGV